MSDPQRHEEPRTWSFNAALWAVTAQVGCLTVGLTFAAFALGYWIDKQLGTYPILILSLTILSVPLNMFLIFRVARKATSRMEDPSKKSE